MEEKADKEVSILMIQTMETYQDHIQKAREIGATKKSYDRVQQEYHQYFQIYPIPSLAVSLCHKAFDKAVAEKLDENAKPDLIKEYGRLMYCNMLPKLINRECIRDFIACVVHGMAVGIITGQDGARLLYGAQVAQQALPAVRKWRKNRTQTAPKPHPNHPYPTTTTPDPAMI